MFKKLVLMSLGCAICTLALGCSGGGGSGSDPAKEAAGKKQIEDIKAAKQRADAAKQADE